MERKSSLTLNKDATNFNVIEKATDLTPQQVSDAFDTLVVNSYVRNFPSTEKYSTDPIHNDQKYFVWSFVPSPGAKPDERGLFGMAKFRGAFATTEECDERSIFLIKNVDSYHEYLYGFVGKPFPVTVNTKYVKEEKIIDVKNDQIRIIGDYVAEKREKEKKDISDIKDREKELLEETEKPVDLNQKYITLRVKKAHLTQAIEDAEKKLIKMKKTLRTTYGEIDELDASNPEFKEDYIERYKQARAEVGIVNDVDNNFIKYIGDESRMDLSNLED